jgi:glycosyltransferase involved in cell wall biosynthesis
MNVLMVHNHYLSPGGEDESTEAEEHLLRDYGHQVDSLRESNQTIQNIGHLKTAARTIWSTPAYRLVREKLRQRKYDVMHVQNFFPLLSPSVYYAARSEGVPVVQTLRNYRLLCPKASFFRDGKVCEESRAGTAVVASMLTAHRFLHTWSNAVDVFVALTEFSKRKFVEGHLPERKILVKPNFVYPDLSIGDGGGKYCIFVGRLAPEKGIGTLLKAWEHLDKHFVLKIIGDGPLANQVGDAARKMCNVEWLGWRIKEETHSLVARAYCLIFPSEWYEGMPRTVIESFAVGTPVLAANIGSMKEMIRDGENGILFKAGDRCDLGLAVRRFLDDSARISSMRRSARADFESKYTAEQNLPLLLDIYERAIQANRNERAAQAI